jgi:hypothetical protein
MVWLKACPRCRGDLFLDSDHYGKFRTCVQCGYSRDLAEVGPADQSPRLAASNHESDLLDLMTAAAAD